MKQTLSGTSLFHFTSTLENIIGIIENGFYPSLCFEEGIIEKSIDQLPDSIVPMVCFCDMRLSDADRGRHTLDYGNYAIGVTKQWAKSHGICPVLYSWPYSETDSKKSFAFTERSMGLIFGNMIKEINRAKNNDIKKSLMNVRDGLGVLLSYTKRYEGRLYKNFTQGDQLIRFYDEREWRYVPIVLDINGRKRFIYDVLTSFIKDAAGIFHTSKPLIVNVDNRNIEMDKARYLSLQNEQFKIQSLKMKSDDITCIVVEKRDEIIGLRNELKNLPNIKDNFDTISIFSFEDIRHDY